MASTAIQQVSRTIMASAAGNAVLFNISWLAIVYTHSATWAPVVVAAHLAIHLGLMGKGLPEARLILGIALFGVLLDQLLFALGVFTVNGVYAPAPLWIGCLWPVLATTLMHAFRTLQQRLLLAAVFGAVGGAMSYTAGTAMTNVQFGSVVWGPVIMSILWALLFPTLLVMARITGTRAEGAHHVAT
jgi:Protein of unknown function (DUF2878)